MWSARLGSAQLVIFVVPVVDGGMKRGGGRNRRLQVVIPDSLESIVAMEIVATDVVCRVGGADPSEGHRAQLGLNGIINSFLNTGLALIYQNMFKVLGIHHLTPSFSCMLH